MKRPTIIIAASMLSIGIALAGPDMRGGTQRARTLEDRRKYETLSYTLPSDHNTKRELDVCRALAAAITQAVVLGETREQRLAHAEDPRKKIIVRGNRVTLSYGRDLYRQQCYMAIGPAQKWKTINGFWAGARVSNRSISRALAVLRANGMKLKSFSISVSSDRHLADAKRLVARLRLGHIAVVGLDKTKPNHASVRFEHNK
jgi:hypothetical protein